LRSVVQNPEAARLDSSTTAHDRARVVRGKSVAAVGISEGLCGSVDVPAFPNEMPAQCGVQDCVRVSELVSQSLDSVCFADFVVRAMV
jgi:hypothetical protein